MNDPSCGHEHLAPQDAPDAFHRRRRCGAGRAVSRLRDAGGARADTAPLAPLNRFPRMVQEFFVERENEIHRATAEEAGGT